jgi:hypothetical protein
VVALRELGAGAVGKALGHEARALAGARPFEGHLIGGGGDGREGGAGQERVGRGKRAFHFSLC